MDYQTGPARARPAKGSYLRHSCLHSVSLSLLLSCSSPLLCRGCHEHWRTLFTSWRSNILHHSVPEAHDATVLIFFVHQSRHLYLSLEQGCALYTSKFALDDLLPSCICLITPTISQSRQTPIDKELAPDGQYREYSEQRPRNRVIRAITLRILEFTLLASCFAAEKVIGPSYAPQRYTAQAVVRSRASLPHWPPAAIPSGSPTSL